MTKVYLESHEIEKLENAASSLRDKLLIRVLFRLDFRMSEVLALEVDNIDFEHRTAIVHLKRGTKLSCDNCGTRLGISYNYCPKCGAKQMVRSKEQERRRQGILPIDKETLDILKEYDERGGR